MSTQRAGCQRPPAAIRSTSPSSRPAPSWVSLTFGLNMNHYVSTRRGTSVAISHSSSTHTGIYVGHMGRLVAAVCHLCALIDRIGGLRRHAERDSALPRPFNSTMLRTKCVRRRACAYEPINCSRHRRRQHSVHAVALGLVRAVRGATRCWGMRDVDSPSPRWSQCVQAVHGLWMSSDRLTYWRIPLSPRS